MERKYGLTPIRRCNTQEEELIKKKLEEVRDKFMESKPNYISWVNIYLNNIFCWKGKEQQAQIFDWCHQLVSELQNGLAQHITNIGFILNPAGSSYHQEYHFDYDESQTVIFIPMTYLTYQNSTQFLTYKPKSKPTVNYKGDQCTFGETDRELLEREGVDSMVISYVICKPFMILKMEAGTVHRGIKNSSNEDRIMLFIGYNAKKILLNEVPVDS